ncbi:MAG: MBL fold metallo-hydrolase [Alphaproteobacteria bacterium]
MTFQVGSFSITRIEEMLTPGFLPDFLFPEFDRAILDEHAQLRAARFWHAESGKVMSSMHSWLIRDGKHTILIDTGCGNAKTRALPVFQRFHQLHLPYLERLAAAGVRPEEVTLVICTHLHIDHVGWNTTLKEGKWRPTFPKARYLFGRREFEHWRNPGGGLAALPENGPVIEDSVMPVIDAGQAEFVDEAARILDGIEIEAAPGHTAGQFMVKLTSGRDAAVFPGDSLHQPMQVYRPLWNSRFCEQAETARSTRRHVLDYCVDRNALLMPAHFGAPHCGRIRRSSTGYAFAPADDLVH